jgi:hypothetical protein
MLFSERIFVAYIVRAVRDGMFTACANAVFMNVEADGIYTYQYASKA